MAKASDNVFARLILAMRTSNLSAPADSSWQLFAKADGVWARSSNTAVGPFGTGGGSGTSLNPGTSFPGGPATSDLCFRTDRGLIYYYDGTRWLTVNEYSLNLTPLDSLWPISATGGGFAYGAVDEGANGAWITRLVAFTLVVGTNDGSNFWTTQVESKAPGGTAHNVGSTFSTSADTAGQNTKHVVTVGAAVTSGDARYQVTCTKTAGASPLYLSATVYYRLIG